MRILHVSGVSPIASGDGSGATLALLRGMCQAGNQVTYAYLDESRRAPPADILADLIRNCDGNVTFLRLPAAPLGLAKPWRVGRAIMQGLYQGGRHTLGGPRHRIWGTLDKGYRLGAMACDFDSSTLNRVQELATPEHCDVVLVGYPWMIRLGARLPTTLPRVFIANELQSVIVGQSYPREHRFQSILRRHEGEQMRRYDAVFTMCDEDADWVRRELAVTYACASPEAIDCSAIASPKAPFDGAGTAKFTFLGGYNHRPNADAVSWLCQDIAPLLRRAFPRICLEIIGRYPADFVKQHASDDIRFLGFVADFTQHLAQSVFLCPLRIGSGMRIKILDASLRGAAVISTTLGARGLGMTPETHYLVADSPDEFAEQALRLFRDEPLRTALISASQEHVVRHFSPEAAARKRQSAIRSVLDSRR